MTEHGKLTREGLPFPKYESPIEVEIIPPMDMMFTAENIFKTEKDEHIEFKCSKCGATAGEVRGGTLDGARFKYCPNCGRILYQ